MKNRKVNKTKKAPPKNGGWGRGLNAILSGGFLTRTFVQRNLPFIFFLVAIMICYIGYGYFAENNMKDMVKAEKELHELKARNLAINAHLEQLKQQSAVAEAIEELGLKESTTPPIIIRTSAKVIHEGPSKR